MRNFTWTWQRVIWVAVGAFSIGYATHRLVEYANGPDSPPSPEAILLGNSIALNPEWEVYETYREKGMKHPSGIRVYRLEGLDRVVSGVSHDFNRTDRKHIFKRLDERMAEKKKSDIYEKLGVKQ